MSADRLNSLLSQSRGSLKVKLSANCGLVQIEFPASGNLTSRQFIASLDDGLRRSGFADESEPNVLLAVKCCIKNNRWADVLNWNACYVANA